MPSLAALRAKAAQNPNSPSNPNNNVAPISPENLVQIPAAAPLDLPVPMPQRGVFPTSMVMSSDRSDSTRAFRSTNTRSAVFQNPPNNQATTVIAPVTASAIATALAILVNNQSAPDQDVLNFLSTTTIQAVVGANGQISFNSLVESQGDGLIHGDLIWDIDDAYSYWREDFRFLNVVTGGLTAGTTNPVQCELPWLVALTTSANGYSYNPGPPFIGALMLGSGSVAANCSFLVPQNNSEPDSANSIRSIDALFEHPNWKMVWNFGLLRPTNSTTATTNAFALTKTSTYVGLANTPALSSYGTSTPARPIAFTGLRYDTDLGAALTLTGATAGVGTTAYAGTITNGGSNAYVGYKFTITGFSGGDTANNGTFTCTASSTTVLTLNNASGVTGSTGTSLTATGPQINDSHFVFESVCNSAFINVSTRINFQGNTADTGITPTEGHFYRLEMTCTAVGTVVMTLTDSIQTAGVTTAVAQFSASIVVPKFTCTNISYQAGDGAAYITNSGTSNTPFAAGSIVTVAHTSATGIDGVQYVIATAAGGASINYLSAASFTNTNASSGTLTGYPAVYPYLAFGNDTNASANAANTKGLFIDFVAFIWNPGVGGNTSPASNPLLSRYF